MTDVKEYAREAASVVSKSYSASGGIGSWAQFEFGRLATAAGSAASAACAMAAIRSGAAIDILSEAVGFSKESNEALSNMFFVRCLVYGGSIQSGAVCAADPVKTVSVFSREFQTVLGGSCKTALYALFGEGKTSRSQLVSALDKLFPELFPRFYLLDGEMLHRLGYYSFISWIETTAASRAKDVGGQFTELSERISAGVSSMRRSNQFLN